MSEEKRTDLESLGEFGTIDLLTKNFLITRESTAFGIGDDAAVLERNEEQFTLISTDMLVEGVHFNLMYVPFKHLGYKAVAVNVSDIVAMNGTPEQITVSIAVSNRFPLEALEELYDGIRLACQHCRDSLGGDILAVAVHIGEHRRRPRRDNAGGRSEEGSRRRHDFIAGTDAQRL